MLEKEAVTPAEVVIKPCSRAFFVYYVAIAIFLLGPRLNPEVRIFGVLHISVAVGTVLALLVIALVIYRKWGQEYRITSRGVVKLWRWPSPGQQEITWENLGEVVVRKGLTQSMLRVGHLLITDKSGGPEIYWSHLAKPQEIKAELERRRS